MEEKETPIEGLKEIYPKIFHDSRGYFLEIFQKEKFLKMGLPGEFVQDNQSFSTKGVLRGLHYQKPPYAQGKLVKVFSGKVLDVAVDIRKHSVNFGKYYKCLLDSERGNMLYIPEGFAHGFFALEDSLFYYKCTNFYNKDSEAGIIWNDEELSIDWETEKYGITPIVSEKDQQLQKFESIKNEA